MASDDAGASREPARYFRTLLLTWLAGAILIDAYLGVTEVVVLRLATLGELFQWDASNVMGAVAFSGGLGVELFGLVLHLAVSLVWAAIFLALRARLAVVRGRPFATGAVFGLAVWAIMRFVVVPVGHAQFGHYTPVTLANVLVGHVLFFGVPVALVARRASP